MRIYVYYTTAGTNSYNNVYFRLNVDVSLTELLLASFILACYLLNATSVL